AAPGRWHESVQLGRSSSRAAIHSSLQQPTGLSSQIQKTFHIMTGLNLELLTVCAEVFSEVPGGYN
ncbi:hypothetical protein, partial [Candidatus Accumulibacter cognatus]|uniref:hypothetical protein n=1 Tax=Candidatus Accumulibacter cognatus TaxID=2954383 RepID=UPI00235B67D3